MRGTSSASLEVSSTNPIQAALTSAATFTPARAAVAGRLACTGSQATVLAVAVTSRRVLAVLGALGAQTGGASLLKGAIRVAFGVVLAMPVTYGVGALFGTTVG